MNYGPFLSDCCEARLSLKEDSPAYICSKCEHECTPMTEYEIAKRQLSREWKKLHDQLPEGSEFITLNGVLVFLIGIVSGLIFMRYIFSLFT